MKQRRSLDRSQLLAIVYAHQLGQTDGEFLNPTNVPVCHLVLGVDGHRQCLDGRQVQRIDFAKVSIGIIEATYVLS